MTNHKPSWESVNSVDAWNAIRESKLYDICKLFAQVMSPELPIEFTLPKTLVLVGCALSGVDIRKAENPDLNGIDLARVIINTGGGQACNVFSLLVANSSGGKDIGGLLNKVAFKHKWMIGTGGSAEGLADALCDIHKGNGIITISEFRNWLDKKAWQSRGGRFMTEAFNLGMFSERFSKKSDSAERVSRYCYPNIIANVQAKTMEQFATSEDIVSGFLGRFIISMPPNQQPDEMPRRPRSFDSHRVLAELGEHINVYAEKTGVVDMPDRYMEDLYDEFHACSALFDSYWKRLINEYGPRLAIMLSVGRSDTSRRINVTPKHMERAEVLIRWFYRMGAEALKFVETSNVAVETEEMIERLLKVIKRHEPCSKSKIGQYFRVAGMMKEDRNRYLAEVVDRGMVKIENRLYSST